MQSIKKIHINIKALAEVKDYKWKYTIVGDGSERKRLKQLCIDLGIERNVEFCGWLSAEKVKERLDQSQVFIMVSKPETLGIAYLEAMSQGNIIIGAKNWGIDGVVNHGKNGFLVEPDNVEDLKEVLIKIWRMDKNAIYQILDASFKTISRLDKYKVSLQYEEEIKKSLGNGGD